MGETGLIQDLGLVLLVAAVAAWLCHRMGLPAVIGYIGAGILVSPHTHAFGLFPDVIQIQAIAQVGLVFVVFGIGRGMSLQRLTRIGSPLILGTMLMATLVLLGCRWIGTMLSWPSEHSLVLAAILLVSSTAVLGKSLRDTKQTNTSFGQTALTVTALDDLVALVMLTIVAAIAGSGAAGAPAVFGTIARLAAMIVAMIVGALLLLPPVLKRLNGSNGAIGGLVIAGILAADSVAQPLAEVVLNEEANATALKIADLPLRSEFGCTIVRIERQGILLPNPKPDTILFPNDKLLLLGTDDNLQSAEAWLSRPRSAVEISEMPGLSELSLGHLMVPRTSRRAGKSLGELGVRSLFGIQVVGIERGYNSLLSSGPKENIEPGDQLLVLGTPAPGIISGSVAFELSRTATGRQTIHRSKYDNNESNYIHHSTGHETPALADRLDDEFARRPQNAER